MPREALAGRCISGIVGAVEDSQVQRIHTYTAIGILVSMGVYARRCVRFVVPDKALASCFGFGIVRAVEDSQVQRIDTFAAVGILVCMGVNA